MPTRGFFNSFQILLKVLHLIVVTQNNKFYRDMIFWMFFFQYKQKLFLPFPRHVAFRRLCLSSLMFSSLYSPCNLLENCFVHQTSFLKSYFSIHMSCCLVYKSMAAFSVTAGIVRTVSIWFVFRIPATVFVVF